MLRRRPGPAVNGEVLHDAADHAVVGRHVRPEADGEAAEEGEELAHEDVEDRRRLVADRVQAGEIDHEVLGPAEVRGHVVSHDHLGGAELLAVQLADEVHFERAHHGVRGEEADDERALVHRGHRPVAEAQVRLRERRHLARRHLQHLERALARGAVAASAAQVDGGTILRARHARERIRVAQEELPAQPGQGGAARAIAVGIARHPQHLPGQDHVREAAGHDQAAVAGLVVEDQGGDARVVGVVRGQAPRAVAGDHEVPGVRVAQGVEDAAALRAVAGAGERHEQARTLRGQPPARMRQDLARRDRVHGNAQARLQRRGQALAGVEGAARAREHDRPRRIGGHAAQRSRDRGEPARHSLGRLQPGDRLLTDLAKRVTIAPAVLLLGPGAQEAADLDGAPAEESEPIVHGSP